MSSIQHYQHLKGALESSARLPPAQDSWRVEVGSHACGWATPSVAQALQRAGLACAKTRCVRLPADNNALAGLAATLRDSGALAGWRNELLDIVTPQGEVIAAIERAAMRPLGLATRAVHLNAFTPGRDIWIARRALHKSTDPGLWDTLVGGLVASGETLSLALLRESHEEAGLQPADLADSREIGEFIVSRPVPEGYQVEAVTVTDCVLPDSCVPRNQDGEVMEIRSAGSDEVLQMIAAGLFTTEAALSILLSMHIASGLS